MILFSFAHPDDESFTGAGTVMKYAALGVASVLVTATRGERGSAGDPPICSSEELPACRERELREAAAIIGFAEVHLLDYQDRRLSEAPVDAVRRRLVGLIRRLRPAIVATFDPHGTNLHPDHIAISRFTSDAIAAAADPRWEPACGPAHIVRRLLWTPPVTPWDAAKDDHLASRAGIDFLLDVTPWRDRCAAALRAHRSQHQSTERCFFNQPDPDRILSVESWRQAWGPPTATRPSGDVFDGM